MTIGLLPFVSRLSCWAWNHAGVYTCMHMASRTRIVAAVSKYGELALWRTATGDAVLERSIENRCIKNSESPATQHANLGTKQVVSLCSPSSTLCRRYITISNRTIFYLNSLNIQICVSQRSRESNGVGLRVVMRITSHNYDVTNVCLDTIVCAWQPPAGLPTTPFEIKYVRPT